MNNIFFSFSYGKQACATQLILYNIKLTNLLSNGKRISDIWFIRVCLCLALIISEHSINTSDVIIINFKFILFHSFIVLVPFQNEMVQIFSTTLSLLATLLLASSAAAKTCVVQNNKSDDSISITQAFNDCKNGGTVHFPRGKTYYPKSLIKISGLKNVNINFAGRIILPPFNTKYKGGSAYLELSGDHIKLYGGGTITGNGQSW